MFIRKKRNKSGTISVFVLSTTTEETIGFFIGKRWIPAQQPQVSCANHDPLVTP